MDIRQEFNVRSSRVLAIGSIGSSFVDVYVVHAKDDPELAISDKPLSTINSEKDLVKYVTAFIESKMDIKTMRAENSKKGQTLLFNDQFVFNVAACDKEYARLVENNGENDEYTISYKADTDEMIANSVPCFLNDKLEWECK